DRRPGGRFGDRADQDRFGQPDRSNLQIQPAPADRRNPRIQRRLRRHDLGGVARGPASMKTLGPRRLSAPRLAPPAAGVLVLMSAAIVSSRSHLSPSPSSQDSDSSNS